MGDVQILICTSVSAAEQAVKWPEKRKTFATAAWFQQVSKDFRTVSCSAKWPSNDGQYVSFAGQKEKGGNVFKKWEISAELCHHG